MHAAEKQSETSCICNSALLRFTEGLVLRNATDMNMKPNIDFNEGLL